MRVAVVTGAIAAAIAIGAAANNGTAPVATVTPASLSFGSRDISAGPTASQAATVGNAAGTAPLTVSAAITGADAGDFALTNPCGTAIGAGSSCAVSVLFDPTTAGVKAATLTVTDNAPGSPHTSTLSGTGTSSGGGGSVIQTAANLWVDSNGGSCTRQSTAGTYSDAQACASMQAAQTAAQGGDQVVVKCAPGLATQTYPAQSLSSASKASVVSYYAESYDQAVTAADTFDAATCATVADLSISIDRVHVWGIQATPTPVAATGCTGATGSLTGCNPSQNFGTYARGGSLTICGGSSGCGATLTTDILVDGFHGRSVFARATHVTMSHASIGSYNSCYTTGGSHIAFTGGQEQDVVGFVVGSDNLSHSESDTISYSYIHDVWQGPNSTEMQNGRTTQGAGADGCGNGSVSGGPHVDCMQNYGGANWIIEGNIFWNCGGDSNIQWASFATGGDQHALIGPFLLENNAFSGTGCCNSISMGSQGNGTDCSVITFRNNYLTGGTNNSNGSCTTSIQWYGNFAGVGPSSCDSHISYTWNVYTTGTACGSNTKTCTPTWSAPATLNTSPHWQTDGLANNPPPDLTLSPSDTCLNKADHAALFPSIDMSLNPRPNPVGTFPEAGPNEIP